MPESDALSRQFDDAAQLYDEVRPRYPGEIVEHIIAFAELPAHGRIFEFGCGTSQMTLPSVDARVEIYRHALHMSRDFVGVQKLRHAWTKRYSGEEYLKLLQTFSDHRSMPEPNKSHFFDAISRVIAQMGGEVMRNYETVALLAMKR